MNDTRFWYEEDGWVCQLCPFRTVHLEKMKLHVARKHPEPKEEPAEILPLIEIELSENAETAVSATEE